MNHTIDFPTCHFLNDFSLFQALKVNNKQINIVCFYANSTITWVSSGSELDEYFLQHVNWISFPMFV